MIKCWMKGHKEDYNATAIYKDGEMILKAGSKISSKLSEKAKLAKIVRQLRNDSSLLDENNILKKDIRFKSPSTAAQYVRGNVINGNRCWKITNTKTSLGDYLNLGA